MKELHSRILWLLLVNGLALLPVLATERAESSGVKAQVSATRPVIIAGHVDSAAAKAPASPALPVLAAGHVGLSHMKAQASATAILIIERCICVTSMCINPAVICLPRCTQDEHGCTHDEHGDTHDGQCGTQDEQGGKQDRKDEQCGKHEEQCGTQDEQCCPAQVLLTLRIPQAIQGCELHLATITINNQPLLPVSVRGESCQGCGANYLLKGKSVTLVFDMQQFLQVTGTEPGAHTVTFMALFGGGHILSASDVIAIVAPVSTPPHPAPPAGCLGQLIVTIVENSLSDACADELKPTADLSATCEMACTVIAEATKKMSNW